MCPSSHILPFLPVPFLSSRERIHTLVLSLSRDPCTIFGRNVAKFVVCTEESREGDPAVVMRNMRQFMSGMTVNWHQSGRLIELEKKWNIQPTKYLADQNARFKDWLAEK